MPNKDIHKRRFYNRIYQKIWRIKNKEKAKEIAKRSRAKALKNKPWLKHHQRAKNRCSSGLYSKRGIKLLMSRVDFKYLWFRDKAYLMEKPSIDRIKGHLGYKKSNCRFLELIDNLKRPKSKRRIV